MTSRNDTVAWQACIAHGALQKATELSTFLDMLDAAVHPEVVVEIGSDVGGTLWAWQQLPTVRRVIGVSLPDGGFATGLPLVTTAEVVHGDSHLSGTLDELATRLGGDPIDMLFIDGDHSYEGVRADVEMYVPLVRLGGIVALHDICHHPQPDVNVDRLWDEITNKENNPGLIWREIIHAPGDWGGIGWFEV